MKIADRLDHLRIEFPGCSTLAYADISTETVLASSSEGGLRQDHLNDLCATAVEMFATPSTTALRDVVGTAGDHDNCIFQVIIMDAQQIGVFVRSTNSPTDALCCVCDPSLDIPAFLPIVRQNLEAIGQDT